MIFYWYNYIPCSVDWNGFYHKMSKYLTTGCISQLKLSVNDVNLVEQWRRAYKYFVYEECNPHIFLALKIF